ncbi:MAG: hypothetical protein NT018_12295 [Armatimonadetes bacterium]|nr:hypothetical protein [Armatimonadota bacterium]
MKLLKKSELKGILALIFIIALLAVAMMASTGKLEQWFGITLFSGPRALDKIVYVSEKDGSPDIYIMNADGTGQEKLTDNANPDSVPAISPLGNKIAFVGSQEASSQVYSIGVKGGKPEQITTATGPKSFPAYRPDGKQLSFVASGKVYVSDPNGENPSAILPSHKETQAALAGLGKSVPAYSIYAWAPDSAAIAGVCKDDNDSDQLIYVPGNKAETLRIPFGAVNERAQITHISWAANTPVLAVTATIGNKGTLTIFDPSAAKGQQLKSMGAQKDLEFSKPALSPDGSTLVVCAKQSGKAGTGALFKMDLTTGQLGPIGKGDFENLIFSPKGDKILATVLYKGGAMRDIVSIDPSTGKVDQLTNDGKSYDAVWTPTSEK